MSAAAAVPAAGVATRESGRGQGLQGGWLWAPALVLGLGVLLNAGLARQLAPQLRVPLQRAVSSTLDGVAGTDLELSREERTAVGMTSYLYRVHGLQGTEGRGGKGFSLYVGYYSSQTHGATIHSPKNCLPGSGWQPQRRPCPGRRKS